MKISQQTLDIIVHINEFANNKLKNINDVSLLLESSNNNDNGKQLFKDFIFTAKYLNGLGKIMMNNMSGNSMTQVKEEEKAVIESSADKVREEYKKNLEKFISQINFLISGINEIEKKSFSERYLNMTRTSLVNLTSLIYDLSWVKKYYNEKGL